MSGLGALGTYHYSLGSHFKARAIHVKAETARVPKPQFKQTNKQTIKQTN